MIYRWDPLWSQRVSTLCVTTGKKKNNKNKKLSEFQLADYGYWKSTISNTNNNCCLIKFRALWSLFANDLHKELLMLHVENILPRLFAFKLQEVSIKYKIIKVKWIIAIEFTKVTKAERLRSM